MYYQEKPPIPSLEPFVRCVWRHRTDIKDNTDCLRLFPDGCLELIFCCQEPPNYQLPDGMRCALPEVSLIGTFSQPLELHFQGQTDLIGIRFRPTRASRIVSGGMAAMTNRIACCTESLNKIIRRKLMECIAKPTKILDIQHVLSDHLRSTDDTKLSKLADEIVKSKGRIPARSVAENFGVHERRLRRWFTDHVGVTPQTLSRILRFRRAFDLIKAMHHPNLANVAIQCGYYDQSHMIRDFNKFAGQSPTSLVNQTRPILALISACRQR